MVLVESSANNPLTNFRSSGMMWQVSGRNEITDFEEVVIIDKEYIDKWTMGLDFKILFKTAAVMLGKAGSM